MIAQLFAVLWWIGCPKPPPPPASVVRPPAEVRTDRTSVAGPIYWSEGGGLCLEVPEGFVGSSGDPPLVLELTQVATGFGVQLRVWALGEPPPPRPGFLEGYVSDGSYRAIPLLAPAQSTTWLAADDSGRMLQSWHAPVGDRTVEVSMVFPPGRSTEGRDLLDPLVRELCTTWHDASDARDN